MRKWKSVPLAVLMAVACGCLKREPHYGPGYELSDGDIVAYALKARDDSFRKNGGRRIIGIRNGTKVVAEFPYVDDGRSTLGFIRYEVGMGEACKQAGGIVRPELVPAAIAAVPKPFCVPKVLVQRDIRITPLH